MSIPVKISLLRRTFAALAAAAALVAVSDAQAQGKVKLTGASGKDECAYSAMSITPDGSVTVQCSGTTTPPPTPTPPPPVETFSTATATMTAPANTTAQVSVARTAPTGASFAATTLYYWYTGNGCKYYDFGALNFGSGATSASIPAQVAAAGTTCIVNLAPPAAPAVLGSQNTTTISVTAGTDPGPVIPGCRAPPQNMQSATFGGMGNPLMHMQASGQVVSLKLPSTGFISGQISITQSPAVYSPNPVVLEASINRCPGVIDEDYGNFCNMKTTNGLSSAIVFLTKPYSTVNGSNAHVYGYCWAGEAGTQYYVNARWSYARCLFEHPTCGFALQHNQGPY